MLLKMLVLLVFITLLVFRHIVNVNVGSVTTTIGLWCY